MDVVRFSVGTLTAIPVRPPSKVDRSVTVPGMIVAPLAVLPLGVLVGLVCWGGRELELAPIAVAATAIAALALGSRAFHLDGLSDTADALTCSYDAERSLEVMKRGDAGPAGASALVLVLGIQVGALTALLGLAWGPLLAGTLVCVSRGVTVVMSVRGVPAARDTGLAATYVGTIAPGVAVACWVVLTGVLAVVMEVNDLPWWRAVVAAALALLTVAWLVRRAARRFGGVAGDVFGAAVEVSLAVLLLAST
ncbi:adenosylcobinamide-GDP ribazoletransferase [Nocardioides sp.]|uniref:adenosylcobinamide-GDP ribazoletransferase n=1 Tax=Nocardioides sp. TaxID=35761 RepID=UPI00286D2D6A|nr:adenosylcobinamide-GDP ribazoletransferase [Nocardioides sp.]